MASNGSAVVSPHERFLISSIDLQLVLHHHQHAFSVVSTVSRKRTGEEERGVILDIIMQISTVQKHTAPCVRHMKCFIIAEENQQ